MAARRFVGLALLPLVVSTASTYAAEPHVTNDHYKLELVASDPQIVTPIGMAFDGQGRLLVVESHTHERPQGYQGPPTDRIRMLADSDGDGKLDHWSTFAEGFRHAMNLLVREDGAVYLTTRHNVVLLRDTDHDGVADKQEELLRLETKDDYPHNALSGIARDVDGSLIVSMGENHGDTYRLIGADGTEIKDGGGQDGFFRMTADGKDVRRFARGVWNPFSVCVLPDGRIFAVDNDPDSSPPCRLLHVVPGGDYGYIYQYGRAGTHPLQAWNGELPGTLPMVCGVGEAPTAVVPHAGGLWVTSWGDHRIDRYELVPHGASYSAKREVVVRGDADFRPTGMAAAPDGSLYFADWVLRDYPVHGRGRIWRLVLPQDELKRPFPLRSRVDLDASADAGNAIDNANSDDPFVHTRGVWQLAHGKPLDCSGPSNARLRLALLEAIRLNRSGDVKTLLQLALQNDDPQVRLFAIRWIADERIKDLRDDVAKLLDKPQPTSQFYLVVLGAVDWLNGEPSQLGREITDELLIRELSNSQRSNEIHALALGLLKPDNKFLTNERLGAYLEAKYQPLRLQAVRVLAQQSSGERFGQLAAIAQNSSQADEVRAEAIVGLTAAAQKYRELLEKLTASDRIVLRREAERMLRLAGLRPAVTEAKPPAVDLAKWNQVLAPIGDADVGRRLFFSPVGGRCSVCHKYDGRGGSVGPDLTRIARNTSRESIIASIVQPSREVAPDYTPWIVTTDDGKTYMALRTPKPDDKGIEEYVDTTGKIFTLASANIEERHVSPTSIMPDNLPSTLSIDDLRDLVTILTLPTSPTSPTQTVSGH
jgi:putative membrane-bound dehydrogenase-like protein